jgi:hypothetical protein
MPPAEAAPGRSLSGWSWRTSQTGKTLSCLMAIAGLFRAMWLLFFY